MTLVLVSREKKKSWENTKLDLHKSSLVKVHQIKPLIVSLQIHSEYEWSPTGAVGKTLLFADWCSVRRPILVLIMMLFCKIGNILPLFKIIQWAISKVPRKTFCRLIWRHKFSVSILKLTPDQLVSVILPPGMSYGSNWDWEEQWNAQQIVAEWVLCHSFSISRDVALFHSSSYREKQEGSFGTLC